MDAATTTPEADAFDIVIQDGRVIKAPDTVSIMILPPTDHAPADDGWQWALVEIFGHRQHAGRCREEERFGAKMLRIDVPVKGDPIRNGWETHWYGGSSIFSFTLTDEESVMRSNKPYEAPTRYRLPAPEDDADGDQQDGMPF